MSNSSAEAHLAVPTKITIASRESALAMWQAEHVRARLIACYPQLQVEILGLTTTGDRILHTALAKVGGKGLFVKELETALESGDADIAVHSLKDVPMEMPQGFALAAVSEREDPRDAFVSNEYPDLESLPAGGRVGTSSLRRESQLRAQFPLLEIIPLRGNIHTRLRKLDEGRYAAIILAAAGLKRLGLSARIAATLSPEQSLPAVGQGALGIECLSSRPELVELLAPLNHLDTAACVLAERAFSRALGGSCQVPLGGYAEISGGMLRLRGFIATPDGGQMLRGETEGKPGAAEILGSRLAQTLIDKGADKILAELAAEGK